MVKFLHQNANASCQASVGSPWFDSFASQHFFVNSFINVNLPGFLQLDWEMSIYYAWQTLGIAVVSHISASLASDSTSVNHQTISNPDFEEEKWNIVYKTCLSA